ncbi:MAG: hypothetical protein IPK88_07635 [Saprospiraceae bacterium]|nr:hypothetical protein [Candidatus Defluviibacterium haderslevense]
MKRSIKFLLFTFFITISCCSSPGSDNNSKKENNVCFVCMGPKSKVYHLVKVCDGLDKCSTPIDQVTIDFAEDELNRRACKLCGR